MRVAVFGSFDWKNYNDFMRYMTVFIQDAYETGHEKIVFVHAGKKGADNMITEYIGKTEKMLRHNKFIVKEELIMGRDQLTDVSIIESGIEFALVFSTKDKRTSACKKILEAYEIPFRIMESA